MIEVTIETRARPGAIIVAEIVTAALPGIARTAAKDANMSHHLSLGVLRVESRTLKQPALRESLHLVRMSYASLTERRHL